MQELVQAIAADADPSTAAVLRRYFQVRPGGYGEGDTFVGVKLSRLRELTTAYAGVPFVPGSWVPLLRSPVHEHRLAALVVMGERARRNTGPRGDADELAQVYATYREHHDRINNWDLVDVSAKLIVGGYLQDRARDPLYALARSALVWERRTAIVAPQSFVKRGETSDVFAIAELLLGDRHDLMHKATGWTLREAGKPDPDGLRTFLDTHLAALPRTTLRYAIERFDGPERQAYLRR